MRPAGTTVARSYYLNLKTDFGAVGDGVTDDTAALNNAATAFSTLGVSIFMPVGNYKTTTGITLSQNTPIQGQKWVGEGYNRSVFVPTGAGVNCITLSGSPYFLGSFEDFGITGAVNTGNGIQQIGTGMLISTFVWKNIQIIVGGECFHLENHYNIILQNCIGAALGYNHVFCLKGGNTTLLEMCRATGLPGSSTVTITGPATPAVVTWTAHGLVNGQQVVFSNTGGALPTGLSLATIYYTVAVTTNTFKVAATPGGTAINTTGVGSGTQTAALPAGTVLKAGYRIGSGAKLLCCNGIDFGDYWGVFGAQASVTGTARVGGANTITLAGPTGPDPFVTGCTNVCVGYNIRLTGTGTGTGQTGLCTAYNYTTRVATVTPAWTIVPDTTTTYSVEDPVSMFQQTIYPQVSMDGCNLEGFGYDGIRLLIWPEGTGFLMNFCQYQASKPYQSMIHFNAGIYPKQTNTIIHVEFNRGGGIARNVGLFSSDSGQDIISDQGQLELLGINCFPNVLSGAYNQWYNISSSSSSLFTSHTSRSIALPNMPTSNPADGSKTMWNNAGAITLGT